jgi:hypothetical protein
MSKTTCTCRKELSYEHNGKLLNEFSKLYEIAKQKQFVRGMLGVSCDGECYTRCFKVAENHFLCRSGVSTVLQLTRRKQQEIVPSPNYIKQRYYMICVSEIFCALLVYRNYVMQTAPNRRHNAYTDSIKWSHPFFANSVEKIRCIHAYRGKDGISTFFSHLQIRKAIKDEKIILGAVGDWRLQKVVSLLNGHVMDLSHNEGYGRVLDELCAIIYNLPATHWKRVSKISRSLPKGGLIEYTSSTIDSLKNWMIANARYGNWSKHKVDVTQMHSLVDTFEMIIKQRIAQFAFQSDKHIVCLQAGALRSLPGTIPQRAHRDFTVKMYQEQFPNQLYIGFMPVTHDGMFLQVWPGPGEAKLLFIPRGNFLLLPGNAVHAGWMCTSIQNYNYRLHFYIIVSREVGILSRKEKYVFENMNTYVDEEAPDKGELHNTHHSALSSGFRKVLGVV